jgi:hypothetical protein
MIVNDNASLPSDVNAFVAALKTEGFDLRESRIEADHFGDALLVLADGTLQVRLISDRGQWFVEVGGTTIDGWFSPMVWRAYLDRSIDDLSTPSFRTQCEMVLGKLQEIEGAVLNDIDLTGQLLIARAKRSRARSDPSGGASSS